MNPSDLHGPLAVGSFWLIVALVVGGAIVAVLLPEIIDEARETRQWWQERRTR